MVTMILKDMYEEKGLRCIWPPPTPPTQRLDFEHFFMMMMIFIINKIITIAIIIKFTIFIITQ